MSNFGLRAQPREDTGLSPAAAVFGAQIVLPNEFLQNDEFSVDTIVKHFSETLHVSAPSLPRHNSSTDLPSELPAELLSPPPSYGSVGTTSAALQQPLPTRSCAMAPAPSPSESGRRTRWLPSAALRLAQPRTPPLAAPVAAADCRARTQAVLPQPSESRFQTRWFLCLLLHRRRHATVRKPYSYPAKRFLHTRDRWHLHSLHKHGTGPVSEHCPRCWTSDPPPPLLLPAEATYFYRFEFNDNCRAKTVQYVVFSDTLSL